MEHYSVLLHESIENLAIKPEGIYVDGTLGRGGHSLEIAKLLNEKGHLYCFDKDTEAIEKSRIRLKDHLDKITFIHSDFCYIKEKLQEYGVDKIDGVLMDLGVSSPQFDQQERGFSYRFDSRLDMRMDTTQSLDAWQVVNHYPIEDLIRILYRYGEESFAKQIARKIEAARQKKTIDTTFELVDVIKSALPAKVLNKKGHPAKQSFQAIRIEVNHELDSLEIGLQSAMEMLNPEGRACVITFHSLEDRIVKEMFAAASNPPKIDKNIPILPKDMPEAEFKLVTRKPILPNQKEEEENKRSHSAKLRVLQKK